MGILVAFILTVVIPWAENRPHRTHVVHRPHVVRRFDAKFQRRPRILRRDSAWIKTK